MNINKYLFWAKQVDLNDNSAEEKLIQISDLLGFISSYNSNMKIIDCINSKYNYVEFNNKIILIYFTSKNNFDCKISITHPVDEKWIVFVKDLYEAEPDFNMNDKRLASFFNRKFEFNFFQSTIQEINND